MTRTVHAEPELRAAWAKYRRASWPVSYEESMRDPVTAAIVRALAAHEAHSARERARHAARALPAATQAAGQRAPLHGARPPLRAALAGLPPGYVDHKRAAAGDRDD